MARQNGDFLVGKVEREGEEPEKPPISQGFFFFGGVLQPTLVLTPARPLSAPLNQAQARAGLGP